MNTKQIESIVLTELHSKHGLDSLHVQNHVYGCFILMEDITESNVGMTGTVITNDGYSFDIEKQFSEIGIRYGFLMDTALEWNTYHEEYKTKWMEMFQHLNQSHDMTMVESTEDAILTLIRSNVKEEDAFLMNALEKGVLSRIWQNKVIALIREKKQPVAPKKEETEETEDDSTGLRRANIEKPVQDKRRGLHKTRRHRKKEDVLPKKKVPNTRRAIKV